HARRVVQGEIAGDEQQEPGNHCAVEREGALLAQSSFPSGGGAGMRAPQEQTRLRTGHSIRSSRPHAWQPM
ncbi:MAG: hypothetical protein ACM3PV_11365, partial [Betaproteobacteria bacterium]